MRYSASKNSVTLKTRLVVVQDYWNWPPSATVFSAEPFSHGTGILRCLQKEMATYRHWSVSLWRDPDDVPHCRIVSPDKTEWRLISATLCGWRPVMVRHAYEKKKKIETGVVRRIRLSNGSTYCKYSQGLPFENEWWSKNRSQGRQSMVIDYYWTVSNVNCKPTTPSITPH